MKRYSCIALLVLAAWTACPAQDSLGVSCVSSLVYWNGAGDLQMVGDTVYAMGGVSGLHIVSLTDPVHPQEVGRCVWYDTDDAYGAVCVADNRAYAMNVAGIRAYDISDPAHPSLLGQWSGAPMGDMLVSGDMGVCEDYGGFVFLLDLHDPANIQRIADLPVFQGTRPCGITDDYLYLGFWGLSVWDISNPLLPTQIAVVDTQYSTWADNVLSGNYVYFATEQAGVRIIDVSDPLHPAEVASCDSGCCYAVALTGNHLAVSVASGMNLWNVADPMHPVYEGHLATQPYCFFRKLSASGHLVCGIPWGGDGRAFGLTGVTVVDISDPASPVAVDSFGQIGTLGRLTVSGDVGYVLDYETGFRTIDLTDPSHAHNLGRAQWSGSAPEGIAVYGDYAYVTDLYHGMYIYDVSHPVQPESLNCWEEGAGFNMLVNGDYLYLARGGLQVVSLANPAAPAYVTTVGQFVTASMTIANGRLYTAGGAGFPYESEFDVGSLSDPAAPVRTGMCHLSIHAFADPAGDVAVVGNYAYVAGPESGMWTVDISDSAHPTESMWMGGPVKTLTAHGNTLITLTESGINVFNLTDPVNPQAVGYYTTPEWLQNVATDGQYVYTTSETQFDVFAVDALSNGFRRIESPHELSLYPAYPNPFNPSTVIRFTLPRTEKTKLIVYDVAGREVKVLEDGLLSAGEHRVTFDGSALSSGVYFARLEAGKNVQAEKLMLLK